MDTKRVVIRTAREGINCVDAERTCNGMTQMSISDAANAGDTGQQYSRMWRSGDCRLSVFLRFARAAGYDIILSKREQEHEKKQGNGLQQIP